MSIANERCIHEKACNRFAVPLQRSIRSDHVHPQPVWWRRNIQRTRGHDNVHAEPVRWRRDLFRSERNDHVHAQSVWGWGHVQWSKWHHHVHTESIRGWRHIQRSRWDNHLHAKPVRGRRIIQWTKWDDDVHAEPIWGWWDLQPVKGRKAIKEQSWDVVLAGSNRPGADLPLVRLDASQCGHSSVRGSEGRPESLVIDRSGRVHCSCIERPRRSKRCTKRWQFAHRHCRSSSRVVWSSGMWPT